LPTLKAKISLYPSLYLEIPFEETFFDFYRPSQGDLSAPIKKWQKVSALLELQELSAISAEAICSHFSFHAIV